MDTIEYMIVELLSLNIIIGFKKMETLEKLKDNLDAEKLFEKLYPEYCNHGKPLHPYIDIFEEGIYYAFDLIEKKGEK